MKKKEKDGLQQSVASFFKPKSQDGGEKDKAPGKEKIHPFFCKRQKKSKSEAREEEEPADTEGNTSSDSDVKVIDAPMAFEKELTDEELLKKNPFFLTHAQKLRKAELEKKKALKAQQKTLQVKNENFKPVSRSELHPFFQPATHQANENRVHSQGKKEGWNASSDPTLWHEMPFPSLQPVLQGDFSLSIETSKNYNGFRGRPTGYPARFSSNEIANIPIAKEEAHVPPPTKAIGDQGGLDVIDIAGAEDDDERCRDIIAHTELSSRISQLRKANDPDNAIGFITKDLINNPHVQDPEKNLLSLAATVGTPARKLGSAIKKMKNLPPSPSLEWLDKYKPQSHEEICGNRHPAKEFFKWLHTWKDIRMNAYNWEESHSVEGSYCEESDEDNMHPNPMMLVGPVGSGKSALVFACAAKLGFEVIEINAGQVRSGAVIKKWFTEATQSQRLPLRKKERDNEKTKGRKRQRANANTAVAQKSSGRLAAKKSAANKTGSTEVPPDAKTLTLILFEEVDITFEGDTGFHSAIRDLMKIAKCPIVLTANVAPRLLCETGVSWYLSRPTDDEVALTLGKICAAEGIGPFPAEVLRRISRYHAGDIRASILTLQMWHSVIQRRLLSYPPPTCDSASPLALGSPDPLCTPQKLPAIPAESVPPETVIAVASDAKSSECEAVLDTPKSKAAEGGLLTSPIRLFEEGNVEMFGKVLPVISEIYPASGKRTGGTEVSIYGGGFLQPLTGESQCPLEVFFGNHKCAQVEVISDIMLKVCTPAAGPEYGMVPVSVRIGYIAFSAIDYRERYNAIFSYRDHDMTDFFPPVPRGPRKVGKKKKLTSSDDEAEADNQQGGAEGAQPLEGGLMEQEALLEEDGVVESKNVGETPAKEKLSRKKRRIIDDEDDDKEEMVQPQEKGDALEVEQEKDATEETLMDDGAALDLDELDDTPVKRSGGRKRRRIIDDEDEDDDQGQEENTGMQMPEEHDSEDKGKQVGVGESEALNSDDIKTDSFGRDLSTEGHGKELEGISAGSEVLEPEQPIEQVVADDKDEAAPSTGPRKDEVGEAEDASEGIGVDVDKSGKEIHNLAEGKENPVESQEGFHQPIEPIDSNTEEAEEGLRLLEDLFTEEPAPFEPDRFEANDMKSLVAEGFFRTYAESLDHCPRDIRLVDRLSSSADLLSLCDVLGSTCGQLDGDILVTHLYPSSGGKHTDQELSPWPLVPGISEELPAVCRLEGINLLGIEEEGDSSAASSTTTGRTSTSPLGLDKEKDEALSGKNFSLKDLEGNLVRRICFQSDRNRRRDVLREIVWSTIEVDPSPSPSWHPYMLDYAPTLRSLHRTLAAKGAPKKRATRRAATSMGLFSDEVLPLLSPISNVLVS